MLHNPVGLESQHEVLHLFLRNSQSLRLKLEVVALHFKVSYNLPFLTGVVHDGDLLLTGQACWHSEFELSPDLLWDGRQFVLIQADVGTIERLEDDIASE